jgi:hypothetical protein
MDAQINRRITDAKLPDRATLIPHDEWSRDQRGADAFHYLVNDLAASGGESVRIFLSKPSSLDLSGLPAYAAQLIFLDDIQATVVGLDQLMEAAQTPLKNA